MFICDIIFINKKHLTSIIKVMKNLAKPVPTAVPDVRKKNLLVDGRGNQGKKSITWNINKLKMTLKTFYISFLFRPTECMDTIRVLQFLYYESMMKLLCFKPSSFCVNETSLYPRNIVGILIKLIFFGGDFFLNNHNNVVFAWIFCMRNMTCLKMGNDVLTFL